MKKIILVNLITGLRVIGAIFLIPIYLNFGSFGLAIFTTIFVLTDSIDGFLARTLHASTFFGAIFDAVSDKLFNIILLCILVFKVPLMIWTLVIEIGIFILGVHNAFKGNKAKTSIIGKIKMIILSICVITILFLLDYDKLVLLFNFPTLSLNTIDMIIDIIVYVAIFSELVTFADYIRRDFNYTKNNELYQKDKRKNKRLFIFTKKLKSKSELKEMLFNHDFYEQNKNMAIEKLVLIDKN